VSTPGADSAFTIGETFTLRRLAAPDAVHLGEQTWSQLGGQSNWFWGVPGVFHALASPSTGQPVPAAPTGAHDEPHSQSLGYWCALQYLLLYRLGWSSPARGLMRWYDDGKPTDDPTFALVSEIWDRDGHLDVYLAWLLRLQPSYLDAANPSNAEWASTPEALSPRWAAWLRTTTDALDRSPMPHFSLTGGADNLHLTGHVGESGKRDPEAGLTVIEGETPRALFVSSSMDAWYWDLRNRATALPPGTHSWRIDVVIKPVGFLGTYRLSRSTSLPFSGRHRYHAMGN